MSTKPRIYVSIALPFALLLGASFDALALPVIPGISGFGTNTPAGRGGAVYKVTNLNDSGPGSLRSCVNQSGSRVCVFEVSGEITLNNHLNIWNPYITIAGQTAPSPGITLRNASLGVHTNDVLVQHLRIRVGDSPDGPDPKRRDGVKVSRADDVVLDHLSVSWALDELMEAWNGTGDVTISNTIFAEPLEDSSVTDDGTRGYGPLLAGGEATRVAFIDNIIAHARARNPRSASARFIFANNLVYNWKNRATEIFGRNNIVSKSTLIGNVYKPGNDTNQSRPISIQPNSASKLAVVPGSKVYVSDNKAPGYNSSNPWSLVNNSAGSSVRASSPPVMIDGFKPMRSGDVEDSVRRKAGARPADRDSVDDRLISDIRTTGGVIIDSQKSVGGVKTLARYSRTLTLPNRPNDDDDDDGYTNLEEWLHGYAQAVETSAVAPPRPPTDVTVN